MAGNRGAEVRDEELVRALRLGAKQLQQRGKGGRQEQRELLDGGGRGCD